MAPKKPADDASLKRLGGGRWQTRDERFTIEPQSGTWVIVDAEQTDDLGLPLVRGPFRSLTAAKEGIEGARGSEAPSSPLAKRIEAAGKQPRKPAKPTAAASSTAKAGKKAGTKAAGDEPDPEPEPEARWIGDLSSRDRGRARRLIERLEKAAVRDAESLVRQDLTGGVPTIARVAIADRLATAAAKRGKGSADIEAVAADIAELLGDGRDDDLDVRWRLVDGDGRPVGLTATDLRAAVKRREASGGPGTDR
jgi:hypothetical protein